MIHQPELEEGEACYYKDDTSIDPDIALSYIGDKVQNILGHLQKDFEGGVSAENLGAKFGGYGSFLPMYQRSLSIWSQPKSPLRVQNPSLSRSPNHPFPERYCSASPPSMCRPSRNLKFTSENASIKQKASLSSDQVAEPGKVELPTNKSGNLTDQRTLKVRIKVGSERMAQYNAEIYNLGLTSPSSTAGNSPDETPNESPANILQIMTSFPVSGDLLLSPLCEGLLNLVRETESSIESEHEAARKSYSVSVKLLNNDVLGGKKTKSIKMRENFEKSENECMVGLDDRKQKNSESEILESRVQPSHDLYFKPLSDTVREVKDVQVKKRKGSKDGVKGRVVSGDLVKDASVERISPCSRGKHEQQGSRASSVEKLGEYRARISQKDFSVHHGHGSKISGNKDRASFQAYLNISEGERIKVAMDNSSLKVGMKATSGEQYGLGMTDAVNKLLFEGEKKSKGCQSSGKLASNLAESLTGGGSAVPKNKYSGKKDVHSGHLSQKDVVDTSLEHLENPKRLGRPSGDRPKNSNLEAAKAKLAYDDKLKEMIPSNQGIITGSEPTVVAPIVIQEDWVGCDRCQKWRLLPYGTKSEQLPDKWVCSMLDWLPGMNCCDISEDETTSAVRASYLLPVPENQYNFQAPADKTLPGVSLASAHHLDQNRQNFASDQIADQVRKQKRKEKLNTVSMSNAGPSDGKKNLQRWAMKNGSSKEVNQSVAGVNAANKSIAQHPNKSAVVVAKLNKRKEGHGTGGKESVRVEKIKSKGALNVDNCQTSGGNLGGIGHCLTSGLPNKAAVRGGNKQSAQKDAIPGGMGNFQIHVKKKKDRIQDLPNYEPMGMKTCNGREVSAKNRKFKDCEDSQHQVETGQDNGSNLQHSKVTMKEGSKDSAFQRRKKSRVTQIEEEFNGCKGDDTSKRKGAEASFLLLRSKEYPINRGIEREQQLRRPRVKPRLTIEDIDKLRKDLGCEQLSTAATSSSSKVSDSCKNRTKFMEVKGSPQESVSSSPVRTTNQNQVSPMTMETVGKVDSRLNDPAMGSLKKFSDMNRSSELLTTRKQKASGVYCPEPFENPVLDFQEGDARDKSSGKLVSGVNLPSDFVNSPLVGIEDNILEKCSPWPTRQTSAQMEPRSGKLLIDLRQGNKQGALCSSKHALGLSVSLKKTFMNSRPLDDSVAGTSKALKDAAIACPRNWTDNFNGHNEVEQSVAVDESLANKNVSSASASTALKEAEELRIHADLIKNSGFGSESNYEYFKAALKFLHGASLLEAYDGESSKQWEMNPMQMYRTAAVVSCKSTTTSRVWHDLQSSLQMLPQGESPSSSASDADNLNNLATVDKATLSKGNDHAGNHVMVPHNCPNFVPLLDFTKDVNSAMEAAKKSHDTLAAAHVKLEESQNKEGIVPVKRAIDFSFQDVEELIRLVWLAFNTIFHQGLGGRRE
ncbi:hypothetical protein Pfo_015948 [Paulownia fortunei]|nr:hypothetical protein Pfo_015948 [Paulownia fortunei]